MIRETQKTCVGFTETCEGPIPHLSIVYDNGAFPAPVKIVTGMRGSKNEPVPYRRKGKLVYALPNGGEVAA
jgi:hypothetical protein